MRRTDLRTQHVAAQVGRRALHGSQIHEVMNSYGQPQESARAIGRIATYFVAETVRVVDRL